MFAAHYEKSFVPAFFTCKVSIDHLPFNLCKNRSAYSQINTVFHNRESGKKLLPGKSLEFRIQRSVRTLWLLILKNCLKEQICGPDNYVC